MFTCTVRVVAPRLIGFWKSTVPADHGEPRTKVALVEPLPEPLLGRKYVEPQVIVPDEPPRFTA